MEIALENENISLQELIEKYKELEKKYENAIFERNLFKEKFEALQKAKYARKAEKSNGQLDLFDDFELEIKLAELQEEEEIKTEKIQSYERKKKKNLVNCKSELPVKVIHVTIEDNKNAIDMKSDEIVKRLCIIPQQYYIEEIHYHKYLIKETAGNKIIIAKDDKYKNPFGKGMISSSLVSNFICDKVINSVPLYRQEQNLKLKGIELSRATMCNYIKAVYNITLPLVQKIEEYIKESKITRSDETPLKIISLKNAPNSKNNSYVWVFSTGKGYHPASCYAVGPTRGRSVLLDFLGNNERYLMSDGYDAYANVPNIKNVYCLAHIRRKFFEIKTKKEGYANAILNKIDELYHIESEIQKKYSGDFENILKCRKELMEEKCKFLFEDLDKLRFKVLNNSPLSKAISYALNCKDGFMRIFEDGRLDLDNNASERKVKSFVIGRKNWLFADTLNGAKYTCSMYTILKTAIENNLNPFKYLTYVIDNLGNNLIKDVNDVLPWSEKIPDDLKV